MKKYLSLFVVLALAFFLNVQGVRAEDSESESREEAGSILQVKTNVEGTVKMEDSDIETRGEVRLGLGLEGLREKLKEERDSAKAKIKELRISVREKFLERFDKAVERITTLKAKVDAKIVELEAKGVVTVAAKNFSANAETKLTAAKSKVTEINTLLAVSINELTAEQKTKLRVLAKDTQTLIIEAHQALKEAVKSLRNEVKLKIEASAKTEVDNDNE